jgi:hypothetical protein
MWQRRSGRTGYRLKQARCREPPLRFQPAINAAVTTITRTITVAAGVFGPGHLGELTWQVPFELVDAVLVRHEALFDRTGVKGPRRLAVAAAGMKLEEA